LHFHEPLNGLGLVLEYGAKANVICATQIQSHNAIQMEELPKLTFPIVLHVTVLGSGYTNSVDSQTTMWYSVTPAIGICWESSLSTEIMLFMHSLERLDRIA